MSTSRWIVRILLVIILLAVCFAAYKGLQQRSPDYYWQKAELALRLGDRNSARDYLRKLVDRQPDHYLAHEQLGKIYLEEAKELGQPDTYDTNPFALRELEHTARLKPSDLELQKNFLEICLKIPYVESAAVAASRVLAVEPNNPHALFALAWDALSKKRYSDAETQLNALDKLSPNPRPFQTMHLWLSFYADNDKEAKLQEVLERSIDSAMKLSDEEVFKQDRFERHSMIGMMVVSVQKAKDGPAATDRTRRIIEICERLAAHDRQSSEAPKSAGEGQTGTGSLFTASEGPVPAEAAKKRVRTPDELAKQGVGYYANLVSAAFISLNEKFPLDPKEVAEKANRDLLSERANKLRLEAIAIDDATPLVYHQAAMVAFNSGRLDDALGLLDQGIESGKGLPDRMQDLVLELHLLAGRQLVMARRFDKLTPHLDRLFKEKRDTYQGWAYLLRGASHTFKGAHETARDDFERAKAKLGGTILVHMALANTYMNLKEWKAALVHLEQLRNVNRNSAEENSWARLQSATDDQILWGEYQAYLELGDHEQAVKRMQALANHPEFGSKSYSMMGHHFMQKKAYREALGVLQEGRQKYPNDLAIAQLFAGLMHALGRTDEATAAVERMAAAAPENLKAQLHLVRWRTQLGQFKEAIELCDALEQSAHRGAPEILTMKAQAQLKANQPENALQTAAELDRIPGGQAIANLVRLAVSLKQKDLAGASEQLNLLDEKLPENPTLAVMDGFVETRMGKFEEAIDKLVKVLDRTNLRDQAGQALLSATLMLAQQKGPAVAEAKIAYYMERMPPNKHLILARSELNFRQGKFDAGMAYLRDLEKVMPNDPIPVLLQAGAFWKRRRADMALPRLEDALKLDPKHVDSLSLKAEILLAEKQYKDAGKAATLALKEKPELVKMELLQIEALLGLERQPEAIKMAQALLEKQPKNAEVRRLLGRIYAEANQTAEAFNIYRQARELNSGAAADWESTGKTDFQLLSDEIALLCKHNRQDEAEKIVQGLVGANPTPFQSLSLAQAFYLAERYSLAREWALKGLAALPENQKPPGYLVLGRIALKAGRESQNSELLLEARESFSRVVAVNPRHYEAASGLAYLLATAFNEPAKAVAIAESLRGDISLDQLPVEFIDTLALVYTQAGKAEAAEEMLWKARDLYPEDPLVNYRLGMVLTQNKKNATARDVLGKCLSLAGLAKERAEEVRKALEQIDRTPAPN